jgi:diacylglycerol O-acyltransferase / wax synthase
VMLSLADSEPEAGITGSTRAKATPSRRLVLGGFPIPRSHVLHRAASLGSSAARQSLNVATSPSHALRLADAVRRDATTVVRMALTPSDAASAIKGDPGVSRRVAWSRPVSLPEIKRIARKHGATVNDVLLAAVSGALRHYLQEQGSKPVEIQAMVPFNLRPLDRPVPRELGNKFGLVFLPLPVGVSGAYRRLIEVHQRMDEIKQSREGVVSYGVLAAAGITPEPVERRIVDLLSGKGTAVVTNVPGPKEPVYLAGVPIRTVLVWAPTSGHIGMSVSLFSYRDEVTVGLMADAVLVPDPSAIVAELEKEIEVLGQVGPRRGGSRGRNARPDTVSVAG